MKMKSFVTTSIALFSFIVVSALPACSLTPTQQSAAISTGQTLASTCAAVNKTCAQIVAEGQLFCAGAGSIIAAVTPLLAPTSVIGVKSAQAVADACPIVAGIQTVPVSPPAAPSMTPVAVAAKPLVAGA